MTWAQWLFEYKALQTREVQQARFEAERFEAQFRGLRDLFVALLGLDFQPGKPTPATEQHAAPPPADPNAPRFVPLSLLVGQPEVIKHFIEAGRRREAEDASINDADFEAFSAALHAQLKTGRSELSGDMVPILTGDLVDIERSRPDLEGLRALGVKIRPGPIDASQVPHSSARPRVLAHGKGLRSDADLAAFGERPGRPGAVPHDIDPAELERFRAALASEE